MCFLTVFQQFGVGYAPMGFNAPGYTAPGARFRPPRYEAPFVPPTDYSANLAMAYIPTLPPIDPSILATMPEPTRKQLLGDHLYAAIEVGGVTFMQDFKLTQQQQSFGTGVMTGRITAILLEQSTEDVLALLQDPESLRDAVEHAAQPEESARLAP